MLTISNGLSFSRIPLAFLFMMENTQLRFVAILLAMITDSIDGYLARRTRSTSFFGAVLDPIADKFFVYFALGALFFEGKIYLIQALMMLSRDFALCAYTTCMVLFGRGKEIMIQAFRAGKIATSLQFIVLTGLVLNFSFPWETYLLFVVLGAMAFFELFYRSSAQAPSRWNILGSS